MHTRDEIISIMEVEQRMRKLETLVTLLVEYINHYDKQRRKRQPPTATVTESWWSDTQKQNKLRSPQP